MRKRKGGGGAGAGGGGGGSELRCRRADGRGWRCSAPVMPGASISMCEKHLLQRLRYQAKTDSNKSKGKALSHFLNRNANRLKKGDIKKIRKNFRKAGEEEEEDMEIKKKRTAQVEYVGPDSVTAKKGERKDNEEVGDEQEEEMDSNSNSCSGSKQMTNFYVGEVMHDPIQRIPKTNGKGKLRKRGEVRCLRKYLANGVMEIALDYDCDYDYRKVAGLELSHSQ